MIFVFAQYTVFLRGQNQSPQPWTRDETFLRFSFETMHVLCSGENGEKITFFQKRFYNNIEHVFQEFQEFFPTT